MEFRWNEWNVEHIANHGVRPAEAEQVVRGAKRPFPVYRGDGKYAAWGATRGRALLQVVFVLDCGGTIFVIHTRPLTDAEKRRLRRRQR
jgi:uncharacterized DUF497 family protein